MTTRRKQIGAALTASALLASGAYALGSQAGDGSAAAGGSRSDESRDRVIFHPAGPPGLADLADRLGVEETALEEAFEEIHESGADPHDKFSEALASELGLPADEVRSKLEALRPEGPEVRPFRPAAIADELARELGLPAAKVRSAFRDAHEGGPEDLAAELGVSEEQLHEAFEAVKPEGGPHPGPLAADIAEALGVEQERVEDALENVGTQMDAEHEQRHDEFTQQLADKLGIPVERVRDALPERPAPPPRGPGGPGAPMHAPPPMR